MRGGPFPSRNCLLLPLRISSGVCVGNLTSFIGGEGFYFMGLGQGSRGAPPSWVCVSSVIVNILKGLDCRAHILDPITSALIHSVGAMFVDDSDLYCWLESMQSAEELYETIQEETKLWGDLLLATGGCLKPENVFGTYWVMSATMVNGNKESWWTGN